MNKKYILIGVFSISFIFVFLLLYDKNGYSNVQDNVINVNNLDENKNKGVGELLKQLM